MTRLLAVLIAALALAPAAVADGPMPNASQNGLGILLNPTTRIVAAGTYDGQQTMLERISATTGEVAYAQPLLGDWGIPNVISTRNEGISADGRLLVLGQIDVTYPRRHSGFVFVDPRSLRVLNAVSLNGDFVYDALSPDGKRLYLIQHTTQNDLSRYVVRAFDIPTLTLLPGRVADRTQKSWVMQGYPIDRVSSPDGRMVYTLYDNPSGFPFVHALDTVKGVAHCVGLPWRGSKSAPYNMRLALHGTTLRVHWYSGRPWLKVDTASYRIAPDRNGGFPWWIAVLAAVAATIVLAYGRRAAATVTARAARGDRSPARLGSWLPLTRPR
jgi:hypothetical protein